ncbi:hypothetical protein RFI_01238 [Reticulomyxa filosa]|uniref:Uncharacterized protein n=1 Tax=Reticulomyxa filosa TaxID=46433 RepID=X6PCM9_RETFI|nr:hypothetical protein RFI_01238 [Reticulomyxa filosa]|eukprot:ETO35824.1 hypothetical protein RFI_01238 [Reticulomyxa filosa]
MSLGVSINSLTAVTTNESWQPDFIAQVKQTVRKKVELSNFAMYLNTVIAAVDGGRVRASCNVVIGGDEKVLNLLFFLNKFKKIIFALAINFLLFLNYSIGISLNAPTIRLRADLSKQNSVVDLGRLNVKSDLNKLKLQYAFASSDLNTSDEMEGVKVYVDKDNDVNRLLRSLDLQLNLLSCIFTSQSEFTTIVCTGELYEIKLRVSALDIRSIMLLLDALLDMVADEIEVSKQETKRRKEFAKKRTASSFVALDKSQITISQNSLFLFISVSLSKI